MTAPGLPDTEHRGLIACLPERLQPYAILARFDRPIGWWLLFWPCAWGLLLAGGKDRWPLLLWFLLGSVVMRGAGCVWNDYVDRDLDRKITRTASRPLASGAIGTRQALLWLAVLAAIGLLVLLQLRWQAQLVALASLAPVAAYPLMKRITWWPQAWLGLVFSWGALVAWVEIGNPAWAVLGLLYAGAICWTIGYDTIYALQDLEDDALVGVRSSARAMGPHVRGGVTLFYGAAAGFWALAFWLLREQWLVLVALLPAATHLGWQIVTLRPDNAADPLAKFRSNRTTGLLVALACLVAGNAGLG
ncbi:4-hydroxybenzoate octaprenyltransferase [Croceicoccus sp. F390]|uniref:4-hydroxybenzoate octaprenyltransferase n=1 Tax=Croceicoccus esteveae TaxID=3075597 RepID=A0ABU2ZFG0_9SPHN|nr:4-hydroxybenzoate octaprenyltransferase [Croceicoccus sp. F390]MDT0575323.1 4-hydroxybenzoate octaprenyltransferase [Croceicoccus sp. F390]